MRELKFRAWNGFEFAYFDLFDGITDWGEIRGVSSPDEQGWVERDWDVTDNMPIMEYIGLHDKNGVEIYEGDLLKLKGQNYEYTFEVYFDEQSGRVDLRWADNPEEWPDWLEWYEIMVKKNFRLEVIGNIMESPELLK